METIRVKKRKVAGRYRHLWTLFIWIGIIAAILKYIDLRVMPPVIRVMDTYAVNSATKIIDTSVVEVLKKAGIATNDLYQRNLDEQGRATAFSADTVLINQLCAQISDEAREKLVVLEKETIGMPLGILTGIDFLAARGPEVLAVRLRPVGEVHVDYKTSFVSEGINQVNYQIWLEIKAVVAVANPLNERTISVNRNIPIVNEYMSGQVPQSMIYPFQWKEQE